MRRIYAARYTDRHGTVETTISSDGCTLTMQIEDTVFEGEDFDSLMPVGGTCSGRFSLHGGALCGCTIETEIPLTVSTPEGDTRGKVSMVLELGEGAANGGLSVEKLRLVLEYDRLRIGSRGEHGWFEDALMDIGAQLPEGTFIRSCFNCRYADYSPYGHGLYGDMLCFANIREEYLAVVTKDDFWGIADRYERRVQETFLCEAFERREAGCGYRG